MRNKLFKWLVWIGVGIVVLFPLSVRAGIVEDVIKEHQLDMKKSEDQCKLSDHLTKLVDNFDKRIKGYYDYHEVCDGEGYEVIDGKVVAGLDKKTVKRAKCHNFEVRNFYVFKLKNGKIVSVSRRFDKRYLIPVNLVYDEGDKMKIESGSLIVTMSQPQEKINYYHIRNCDIDFEQKINDKRSTRNQGSKP